MEPASRFAYFSIGFRFILLNPSLKMSTIVIIVLIVTIEKSKDTIIAPWILFWAAGYMTRGISGSHGPKIKIMKRIHGVELNVSSS
jgi:hypothetical protein